MSALLPLVRGFLQSADFKILEDGNEYLVADKLVFQQERDTWLIWTVPEDEELARYESRLNASISALRPKWPDAKAYVIAKSRSGLSRPLQQRLTDEGIRFSVPVQFFDAPFSVEEASPKAVSVIRDLRSQATLDQRVPQPYLRPGVDESGEDDLFERLSTELAQAPQEASVRVVVGRAGIGKSFLFRALFRATYERFLADKASLGFLPRPIPLMPEYLKGIYALRTELLVENFLRTDVASPVGRNTFEWLLVNGFATWSLDGLDELYAGDPGFFDYLADLLTRPGSKAQITIFSRDSLLTTSDAFLEFQELCGNTALSMYHLREWERPAKRLFAWLKLVGKAPAIDEADPPPVASFLKRLDGSKTASLLAGLPFYCDVLLDQHAHSDLRDPIDEVDLLEYIIDRMLQREINKGLIDIRMFEAGGLRDWLEQIAANYVDNRYSDVDRDEAIEYGQLVLKDGVAQDVERHILTSLLQFPFFRAGSATGRVGFAHDLIAEALAAPIYLKRLRTNPVAVARRLASVDFSDPTLIRYMAAKMNGHEPALRAALANAGPQERSSAALLSLLMLVRPDRDLLKRLGLELEARNFIGVRFDSRDLSGLSLRRADLSHAVFTKCDLRDTQLEGAYFHRTRFDGSNQLTGAEFGDLSRVQSIIVDGKLHEDSGAIRKWVVAQTGRSEVVSRPCAAALQTLHMLGKFVSALGAPRRDELHRTGLLAGKRYPGAPAPQECLDELARTHYLSGPDWRDRFRRAEGDSYAEMVRFVRDGTTSDGIGRVIARLCRQHGCLHQVGGRV
jgi:Pentapeptide repeats (8 copies)